MTTGSAQFPTGHDAPTPAVAGYLTASRSGDYGAPLVVGKAPGTGALADCCANHRARCYFGHPHTWTTWYHQGHLVRTADTWACQCGAVCTAEEACGVPDAR